MDKQRKKELVEQYNQIKIYMGVIQIKNKTNGRIYITSSPNLKNQWMRLKGHFESNMFENSQMQKDWNELGEDSFEFEILEQKDTQDIADKRWELKQMEKKWIEELQPFGDKGYNKP